MVEEIDFATLCENVGTASNVTQAVCLLRQVRIATTEEAAGVECPWRDFGTTGRVVDLGLASQDELPFPKLLYPILQTIINLSETGSGISTGAADIVTGVDTFFLIFAVCRRLSRMVPYILIWLVHSRFVRFYGSIPWQRLLLLAGEEPSRYYSACTIGDLGSDRR